MRPWRIHWRRKTRQKNEISKYSSSSSSSKQQQTIITSSSMFLSQTKNAQRRAGASTRYWYVSHLGQLRQPRKNLKWGLLQKAATKGDRCIARMLLRFGLVVRRPWHPPNAKTAAIQVLQLIIQMGLRKNKFRTWYFGDPQTGEVH